MKTRNYHALVYFFNAARIGSRAEFRRACVAMGLRTTAIRLGYMRATS